MQRRIPSATRDDDIAAGARQNGDSVRQRIPHLRVSESTATPITVSRAMKRNTVELLSMID